MWIYGGDVMNESEEELRERRIYAELPVARSVAIMIIPTVISQIVTVIYNLADTWYVGLTGNAEAVAAISLCLPIYNIMTAVANLFGIGGASAVSRAMGNGRRKNASDAFALSVWGSVIAAILYSLFLAVFSKPLLTAIGADAENMGLAVNYTAVTMVIGGLPTVLSAVFAHLVRSTGKSGVASFGITLGAVLNILLDPLFMFLLLPKGNEVLGAAIATALSNTVSALFFLIYILCRRKNLVFGFALRKTDDVKETSKDILKSGLPSFILLAAGQISNCFLNGMIADLGASAAVAAIGVVRKIDSLAYAVNQGITQGMLPIVSYCFAARKFGRMKSVITFSAACTVIFSVLSSACSYIFAPELISFFIDDTDTVLYGTEFLRVLCIAVAIYPLLFVIIAVFQAVGDGVRPFCLSLLHKGSVDILLLFIVRSLFGTKAVLWVAPSMAAIALAVGIIMISEFFRKKTDLS